MKNRFNLVYTYMINATCLQVIQVDLAFRDIFKLAIYLHRYFLEWRYYLSWENPPCCSNADYCKKKKRCNQPIFAEALLVTYKNLSHTYEKNDGCAPISNLYWKTWDNVGSNLDAVAKVIICVGNITASAVCRPRRSRVRFRGQLLIV